MRVIIFFDLPMVTANDRREYGKFRKRLIKEGFIMLQESVYSKLVLNPTAAELLKRRLYNIKPKSGLVQLLVVTEKQYANIEYLVGEKSNGVLETTERLVIL